jgi:hypothetical protein
MARPRDYAAEYARRIASGLRRGLSRSQARGHPKRLERLVTEPTPRAAPEHRPPADDKVFNALERMAHGQTLEQAARAEHISPERLRRVAHERGYLGKTYERTTRGPWTVNTGNSRPVLTTDGTYLEAVPFDLRNTSIVSRYWWAVRRLLDEGDPVPLQRLGTVTVRDKAGNIYHLEMNPNAILRWWASLTDAERRNFGRLFGSEKITVRRRAA